MKKEEIAYTAKEIEEAFLKELDNDLSQQQEKLIQELFDMVYTWGRYGIVVDHNSPAYRDLIRDLLFIGSVTRMGGENNEQ